MRTYIYTDGRCGVALARSGCQAPLRYRQTGLTMVELMVAMAISLFIALAAVTALTVTRRGFGTVDVASQLRDNSRFAADLIQRLVVQSGFKDVQYAATDSASATEITPSITGYNNAAVSTLTAGADTFNGAFSVTTKTAINGSDILILRNQLIELSPGSGTADGSMIDCNGNSPTNAGTSAASTRDERWPSILYVDNSMGEPSLMCRTFNPQTLVASKPQPIITGVETFQVLYGTQGVTANTAPTPTYGITFGAATPAALTIFTPNPPTTAGTTALAAWNAAWCKWANPCSCSDASLCTWSNIKDSINGVPDRYLRADQLTVAGDTVGTNANWRRVRSVRVGMVLRGPPNSAQSTETGVIYYPFGRGKSSASGTPGSGFANSADIGSAFTAPADGRLRQVLTFSVHLRNNQGL